MNAKVYSPEELNHATGLDIGGLLGRRERSEAWRRWGRVSE